MKKIILASQSPRRRELLKATGIDFEILVTNVNEQIEEKCIPEEYCLKVAMRKAEAATKLVTKSKIIISADTIVAVGDTVLGKPKDENDSYQMLKTLSGKWHSVYTALVLVFMDSSKPEFCKSVCETKVLFKKLTDEQIYAYIATKEPEDKAGSYAIQGLGRNFVEKIEGDYNNVVGLPTDLLMNILKEKGEI